MKTITLNKVTVPAMVGNWYMLKDSPDTAFLVMAANIAHNNVILKTVELGGIVQEGVKNFFLERNRVYYLPFGSFVVELTEQEANDFIDDRRSEVLAFFEEISSRGENSENRFDNYDPEFGALINKALAYNPTKKS